MTLNNTQPLFNPATYYQIEVRGRVDVEWLQSFYTSAEISAGEGSQKEDITVLNVHTDQAGIVGLVRRLHSLGMTILQLQIVPNERRAVEFEERS